MFSLRYTVVRADVCVLECDVLRDTLTDKLLEVITSTNHTQGVQQSQSAGYFWSLLGYTDL